MMTEDWVDYFIPAVNGFPPNELLCFSWIVHKTIICVYVLWCVAGMMSAALAFTVDLDIFI